MADAEPLSPPRAPYRTMREFADDERPRERLIRHGAEVLSDAELIAIVLGSGIPGENVVDMARALIESLGGLSGLARADVGSLQRARGLGPAKAAQVAAAVELGRRVQQLDPDSRPLLTSPEAVYALLHPRLVGQSKEWLYALALDTRGRLIGAISPVLGGSVNSVNVRPAEVFREAIVLDAASVILAHNHPSGDPRPSPQDVAVTKTLIAAGALLDLELLDHVVLGHNSFISLQREGYGWEKRR
jgi:DNA repair protein RadC